jgi:MFS family permease
VHQCYFIWTETFLQHIHVATNWTGSVMSLGQIAEIGTMAVLGLVLKRLGWRTTMVLGILGHTIRFGVFALFPYQVPVIASILLHGVCYAFFFATVYIFVDEYLPKDARSSAQGLFNFLILGLGPFVGNILWPLLGNLFKQGDSLNFRLLFLAPSATALLAAVLLALFFHPPRIDAPAAGKPGPAH